MNIYTVVYFDINLSIKECLCWLFVEMSHYPPFSSHSYLFLPQSYITMSYMYSSPFQLSHLKLFFCFHLNILRREGKLKPHHCFIRRTSYSNRLEFLSSQYLNSYMLPFLVLQYIVGHMPIPFAQLFLASPWTFSKVNDSTFSPFLCWRYLFILTSLISPHKPSSLGADAFMHTYEIKWCLALFNNVIGNSCTWIKYQYNYLCLSWFDIYIYWMLLFTCGIIFSIYML